MKIISSKQVYSCRIFTVTEDVAHDDSGFEINRSIVRHPGSAVMMAIDERDRVLLVRQYRLPPDRSMWELPAGKIDPGETAIEAARRELKEETGYTAANWTNVVSYWPTPGYCEEKMHLFMATGLTVGQATPMDDERIEIRWFTPGEIEAMIRSGEMQDGKTLVGFLYWRALYKPANQS
jgi:ADP-ribose pyrophosphatase